MVRVRVKKELVKLKIALTYLDKQVRSLTNILPVNTPSVYLPPVSIHRDMSRMLHFPQWCQRMTLYHL